MMQDRPPGGRYFLRRTGLDLDRPIHPSSNSAGKCNKGCPTPHLRRQVLVELLIDRVIATDGEIEIRYVMPTTRASDQVRFCQVPSRMGWKLRVA
jgi:hypothetical protein